MLLTAEQWLQREKKEHLEYYATKKRAKRAIEPSVKLFLSNEEHEKALCMRVKLCDKESHPNDTRLMEYTEANFYKDKNGVLTHCKHCKKTKQKNERKEEHEKNLVVYGTAKDWFNATAKETTTDGKTIGFCREPKKEEFASKDEYDKAKIVQDERQKEARAAFCARSDVRKKDNDRKKEKRKRDKETEEGRQLLKKRLDANRFSNSRSHTKKRLLQYNLSKAKEDEINNAKICFYCHGDNDGNSLGTDRKNNPICYEDSDVVPCCKYCNRMKGCLRYDAFMEACKNIVEFQTLGKRAERFVNWRVDLRELWEKSNKKGEKYICNGQECCFRSKFYSCASRRYSDYKYDAVKSRNLSFELTKEKYLEIVESPCTFCGYNLEDVGIDRIDNAKGYSNDNCQPACTTCNFMKFDRTNEEFLRHAKQVWECM